MTLLSALTIALSHDFDVSKYYLNTTFKLELRSLRYCLGLELAGYSKVIILS